MVQNLQLIAFLYDTPSDLPQDWFQKVTGVEPETNSKRFRREDSAILGGRHITLLCELSRIAWAEAAIFDSEIAANSIPTLGTLSEASIRFSTLMHQWLPLCPPVQRLSVAGRALRPTGDKITSYRLLNNYLHDVEVDGSVSSDFMYRINRRRPSRSLGDREINRLSTWSGVEFTLTIDSGNSPIRVASHTACSYEFDINTAHECTSIIPPEKLIPLFDELLALSLEIAEKGDIK